MTTDLTGGSPGSAAAEPAPRPGPASRPDLVTRAFTLLTEKAASLYAAALLRIGYGLLYLAFLLREFPHRDEIWGPGSPWTPDLSRELQGDTGWFSVMTLSDNPAWSQAWYALALLTCAVFALGWRTRAVSVLFALVVVSFHGRAVLMTDAGDNLIVLMAIYLALTACGRRWSLDARRQRRGRPGPVTRFGVRLRQAVPEGRRAALRQTALVRQRLTTVLHNCGMAVIAGQVCVLYGATSLYKVQGNEWRDGTALHYVLHLDLFQPWPALAHLADQHPVILSAACYLTVLVQLALPFVLFSRLKYAVLALLLGMHLGIAVLMGLPVLSGAMLVADAVFLPDRLLTRLRFPLRARPALTPAPVPVPAQA